jgi:hypothetical protein
MNARHARACFAVAVALLLASCGANLRQTMIGEPAPPEGTVDDVAVFSAREPSCPFDEIAIVSARKELFPLSGDELLSALKARAWELGAHAVVGLREIPAQSDEDGSSLTGTAIRFTDPDCRR